eukprot:gene45739-55983_t
MSKKASGGGGVVTIQSIYVMSQYEPNVTDETIQVQSDRVVMQDGQSKATVFFDHIFKNQHDFAKSAYNATLAPLVQKVIKNEPALFVCGGLHSTQMQHYMMSQTVMQGLLSQAASQLVHHVHAQEPPQYAVTFSWCKVNAASDAISAAQHVGNGVAGGGGHGH